MANNYTQLTVYPELPKSLLTEKELEQLSFAGFSSEELGYDQLYLYVEEGFVEDDVDENGEEFNVFEIFQNVIKRSEESEEEEDIDEIILEGAFTCSKMRPGEFGGFVTRITKDNIQSASTASLLEMMRQEAHWLLY